MDPNSTNSELPPPLAIQNPASGRRSLPPSTSREFHGPQTDYALPSYPSSTIHYYYPHSHAPYGSLPIRPSSSHLPYGGVTEALAILPSVSQSRVPSLRHTPSVHSASPALNLDNLDTRSPLLDKNSPLLDTHLDNPSRASHRLPSPSVHFNPTSSPPVFAPQPVHSNLPYNTLPLSHIPQHVPPPLLVPSYQNNFPYFTYQF